MTAATSVILDGKATADNRLNALALKIQSIADSNKPLPKLVVMLIGDNPASQVYVNKKAKTAHKLGMLSEVLTYPANASQDFITDELKKLNADPSVHGILIQLPLPKHLDSLALLSQIDPNKDVDGLHPNNLGKLLAGQMPVAKPCTPAGMITLLETYKVKIEGKHAVVIGRSNIVGKPMGLLLLAENATVTYCHSKTPNLAAMAKQADIIVAAVGIPELITPEYCKPGVVILDVGINRTAEGKLVGDVNFNAVKDIASAITPVPGGVGPMTIATLMENTVALYEAVL